MDLPQERALFSSIEMDAAKKLAVEIDPNERHTVLSSTENPIVDVSFSSEFSPATMQECFLARCTFNQVNFSGINSSHATLKDCRFNRCSFANSNFKASDFTGSILNFDASASSFDSSDFTNTTFINANLEGCSFSDSNFYNVHMLNSKIIHSEFVGTKFSKVYFNDLDMVKINLDYAEFEQVDFINVTLPYWGVLHVVKGLWEILSANSVNFSTIDGTHSVSKNKYIEEVSLLRPHFYQKRDFLALANLYVFDGEYEKAYYAILLGISDACKHGRLEQLKYLCRMASLNKFFSRVQLRKLYQQIEISIASATLSPVQYKNYLQELDSAKRLLIDQPFERDTISITIQTSIQNHEYEKFLQTQKIIDGILLETAPTAVSHIEVRHNSPLEIVIQVSENVWYLLTFFALIDFVFDKSTTYIERVQNIILNHKKIRKNLEESDKITQLEKQVKEMQKAIEQWEKKVPANSPLILSGSDEFRRISYALYAKDTIPEELRTYCSSKK